MCVRTDGMSWTSWSLSIISVTSSSPTLCGISSDTSMHQRRGESIWKPSSPSSATGFVPVIQVLSESWASVLVSAYTHTHTHTCILALICSDLSQHPHRHRQYVCNRLKLNHLYISVCTLLTVVCSDSMTWRWRFRKALGLFSDERGFELWLTHWRGIWTFMGVEVPQIGGSGKQMCNWPLLGPAILLHITKIVACYTHTHIDRLSSDSFSIYM